MNAPANSYYWPFSAGGLSSTAEDLGKWNDALHNGKLMGKEMYNEFITPTSLINITVTCYAKGIMVGAKHGRKTYAHTGDIQGYSCESRYFPNEQTSILVLTNTNGPIAPGMICEKIGDHIFGQPPPKEPFAGSLAPFKGTFSGTVRTGRIDQGNDR